jgi:hypothetical protein
LDRQVIRNNSPSFFYWGHKIKLSGIIALRKAGKFVDPLFLSHRKSPDLITISENLPITDLGGLLQRKSSEGISQQEEDRPVRKTESLVIENCLTSLLKSNIRRFTSC